MNPADLTYEKCEQIKHICAKHGGFDVRIFGSVARFESDDKSDLDILINIDASKFSHFDYLIAIDDMEIELGALVGCKVDVVDEAWLKDSMRKNVLRDALSL